MIKEVFKPASFGEAVKLKGSDVYYLSGGTQINWTPAMDERKLMGKPQIEKVVLLSGLLSKEIKKEGSAVFIGAGASLQNLIDDSLIPDALKKAAGYIASRNIRNMATIGGNIAANRADSYVIPCLIALKADVDTEDEGIMCVEKYVREEKDSLIKQIILPPLDGVCVIDAALKSSGSFPSVTTAVMVSSREVVVAIGCVSKHVVRLKNLEAGILNGSLKRDSLIAAVADEISPVGDLQGSVEYKKYISGTMIAHSVERGYKL
ncbi:MAG: FAD binding domain-containing protein [Spirochaetales bacterium]|nr:FAD binding domain-containing protein [Spirochaetales bacterium]MCK5199615.1 FAD binding domain-containing protein [Spirochaetales bacterium]